MRRLRLSLGLTVFTVTLLAMAAPALAHVGTGGEGWYGETTDKAITMIMFAVIAFFPCLLLVLSLIQWRLDKRKHERLDAARRHAVSADWRGGW